MLAVLATATLTSLASLVGGRAFFAALGRQEWTWLEGAVGLALLMIVAQVTIRLPGRAVTSLVVIGLMLAGALIYLGRTRGLRIDRELLLAGLPIAAIVLVAGVVPFILTGRTGVLGEGIYSNDQAVHLYWADWLQNGIGPRPNGLGLGYPVGPHSVVAVVSTASGASIESAFNGFLIAIPTLTALTSLAALGELPAVRRFVAAGLVGLPYLGAAFLAQSSFKETTVALFLLAFALSLALLTKPGRARAPIAALAVLAVAAVLTLSIPALAWFGLAGLIWLAAALTTKQIPVTPRELAARLRRAWPLLAAIAVAIGVLLLVQFDALTRFVDQVNAVQASTGRLLAREPPWQVLGIWPQGDFRVPTAAVTGAWVAVGLGVVAILVAAPSWLRRRDLAVPAALAAAAIVYIYALAFAGIHVQAKSLTVAAPLLMLLVVRGLLEPRNRLRIALGVVFVVAAAGSTFLALRQAPVGTTARALELELLRDRVDGADVVFLGLDRFAPYRLSGANTVQSPGGYVPQPVHARRGKTWVQGEQLDFDSLPSRTYDRFDYAITTTTPYASSAPANFSAVYRTPNFILWKRGGATPERGTLRNEDGSPGVKLRCGKRRASPLAGARGIAGVIPRPLVRPDDAWSASSSFIAPGQATLDIKLPPGRWQLALQYNSEVDVRMTAAAGSGASLLDAELPPALEGMYAFAPGRGPFWPLGEIETRGGLVRFTATGLDPTTLERLVHAQRRVWLGRLAAVPAGDPAAAAPGPPIADEVPLSRACNRYVDWYQLRK